MLINEIVKGSPAEKYGLKTGDVIIEIDNQKLKDNNDLAIAVNSKTPGTKIVLKIYRDNKIIEKEIILGERDNKK